jgi:hypothetical protein
MKESNETVAANGIIHMQYISPISGKIHFIKVCAEDVEKVKTQIRKNNLFNLCEWLLKDRKKHINQLRTANPLKVTKQLNDSLLLVSANMQIFNTLVTVHQLGVYTLAEIYPYFILMHTEGEEFINSNYLQKTALLHDLLKNISNSQFIAMKTPEKGKKAITL